MTDKQAKEMEEITMGMEKEESFEILDIFNYQKVFDAAGIENNDPTFWIWVVLFYIILFIPIWVVVRMILFLILPKSWLKWLFKV